MSTAKTDVPSPRLPQEPGLSASHGSLAANHLTARNINIGGRPAADPKPVSVAPPLGLQDASRPLRGREAVLERVERDLLAPERGRMVVVCGMGGCGKTTLALEIAARHVGAGRRVWWVDARSGPALEAGLRAVARQAGLAPEALDEGDAVDALWTRLSGFSEQWLLIVDNANDPALLNGPGQLAAGTGWVRPGTGLGAVLVTTQDSAQATWGPAGRLHRLHPLTDGELDHAAQILLDHAGRSAGTKEQARALAERLGGLPLALYLAGTYLARANDMPHALRALGTPDTYLSYRQAWQDSPASLDPGQVLARTWAMSVELLERRGRIHTRALLELIAAFADADLPYTLLLAPQRLAGADRFAALDGPTLWEHLTALGSLGLIDLPRSDPGALPVLRMHPLVRDASRTHGTHAAASALLHATALADDTGKPEDPAAWVAWRSVNPHILGAFHYAARHPDIPGSTDLGEAAVLACHYLHAAGLHAQARTELEAILAIQRNRLGDTHLSTLSTRDELAGVLHAQGHWAAARNELEAVLAARREQLGETHPDTLSTWHSLAWVMYDQGHLDTSHAAFEAVLAARREQLGETHPDTLDARHNVAWVMYDQGHWDSSRTELRAVLAARRERLGESHPDTLITRHSLAWILLDQGHPDDARPELEAVLAVQREQLGDVHRDTLVTRQNIGWLLHGQGDLGGARSEFEAVLAARREQFGDTHRDTLVTRHELARVLQDQGDLDGARSEFEAVLAVQREQLGDVHRDTLVTRHNIGWLLQSQGDLGGARSEFEAVLAARREQFGDTHRYTLVTRHELARILQDQGDLDGARSEFEAVLAVQREQLGDVHRDTLVTRHNIGWLLQSQGDLGGARSEFEAVL
ncbi:tetratricopeptide repeat protein, partial [Kitasatospora griseola]|uniref:tetratricopeptide repeat protein n=1 Tax=Kitasatospora griseola TaxID=2064 RepID=UPI0036DD592B